MERILLASASPRRSEALSALGFPIAVRPADVDESLRDDEPVARRVRSLAADKARAVAGTAGQGDPRWVLGADTLVAVEDRVLGKPRDRAEATAHLALLSGREHTVHSGLALVDRRSGDVLEAASATLVEFLHLSETEIEWYLDSGEWEGVAGSYRIQERAALFAARVDGSYSGVVGLPLAVLYGMLRTAGYRF
ncbi:MAG: septum formation protein Maf [Spirochaetales bacterium]|nr:septum formation protein Maf [Spirochaetales bacterium]